MTRQKETPSTSGKSVEGPMTLREQFKALRVLYPHMHEEFDLAYRAGAEAQREKDAQEAEKFSQFAYYPRKIAEAIRAAGIEEK